MRDSTSSASISSDICRTLPWMRESRRFCSSVASGSDSSSSPAWPAIVVSGERRSCETEAVNASSSRLARASDSFASRSWRWLGSIRMPGRKRHSRIAVGTDAAAATSLTVPSTQ